MVNVSGLMSLALRLPKKLLFPAALCLATLATPTNIANAQTSAPGLSSATASSTTTTNPSPLTEYCIENPEECLEVEVGSKVGKGGVKYWNEISSKVTTEDNTLAFRVADAALNTLGADIRIEDGLPVIYDTDDDDINPWKAFMISVANNGMVFERPDGRIIRHTPTEGFKIDALGNVYGFRDTVVTIGSQEYNNATKVRCRIKEDGTIEILLPEETEPSVAVAPQPVPQMALQPKIDNAPPAPIAPAEPLDFRVGSAVDLGTSPIGKYAPHGAALYGEVGLGPVGGAHVSLTGKFVARGGMEEVDPAVQALVGIKVRPNNFDGKGPFVQIEAGQIAAGMGHLTEFNPAGSAIGVGQAAGGEPVVGKGAEVTAGIYTRNINARISYAQTFNGEGASGVRFKETAASITGRFGNLELGAGGSMVDINNPDGVDSVNRKVSTGNLGADYALNDNWDAGISAECGRSKTTISEVAGVSRETTSCTVYPNLTYNFNGSGKTRAAVTFGPTWGREETETNIPGLSIPAEKNEGFGARAGLKLKF